MFSQSSLDLSSFTLSTNAFFKSRFALNESSIFLKNLDLLLKNSLNEFQNSLLIFLVEDFGTPPIEFHLSFNDNTSLVLLFHSLNLSDLKFFNLFISSRSFDFFSKFSLSDSLIFEIKSFFFL